MKNNRLPRQRKSCPLPRCRGSLCIRVAESADVHIHTAGHAVDAAGAGVLPDVIAVAEIQRIAVLAIQILYLLMLA